MVYYDPFTQRIIVLNKVTPPGHAQFEELSSEQRDNDMILSELLRMLVSSHPKETLNMKLQYVSKGKTAT